MVIVNALHIMLHPGQALAEIRRVLKPDGLLFAPTFLYGNSAGFRVGIHLMKRVAFRTCYAWAEGEFRALPERRYFMLFIIECVLTCGLFTLLVLPPLYKNPLGQIMSYPKEIRRRVELLPQYQGRIRAVEKKHLSIKVSAVFLFALILAAVAYASRAKTFSAAFAHVFLLFLSVNLYDLWVLDLWLFRRSTKTTIPGQRIWNRHIKIPGTTSEGPGSASFSTSLFLCYPRASSMLCRCFRTDSSRRTIWSGGYGLSARGRSDPQGRKRQITAK